MQRRIVGMFAVLGLALSIHAFAGASTETQTLAARKLIVKLREPLAKDIEEALRSGATAVNATTASSVATESLRAFFRRYSIDGLTPLYPDMVRAKLRSQASSRQLADQVRQRFLHRSVRHRAAFQPPDISRTYVLEAPGTSLEMSEMLRLLNADPGVEFAEALKTYRTCDLPDDPYLKTSGTWGQTYQDLWGLHTIDAPGAWNVSTGLGVVVAVVDTGIDYTHADIAANVWTNAREIAGNGVDDDGNGFVDDTRGWNFVGQNNDPADDQGHGTHVAGTIAAAGNNGIGVAGVSWRSKVMALKGLTAAGSGDETTLAPAILYAANNGADVLSLSWGGTGTSQTIAEAIDYAYNMGVVVVAAAGNMQIDAMNFYPANRWNVITVAASDPANNLASFSNFGSKIDVAAPGVDILSLRAAGTTIGSIVGTGYTRLSGTSMAAPHVSGLAALLLSIHPEYSNEGVRQAIRSSADDTGATGFDFRFGYGRINASAAAALSGVLEAKISSPVNGATIRSSIDIVGVARGSGFARYVLEYGQGQEPSTWTSLQTGFAPVSGTLGAIDATTIPSGIYVIRLTVFNQAGRSFVDRVQLWAASVAITSPPLPVSPTASLEFKPGGVISIDGAMDSRDFESFRVEWAKGIYPFSGWQSTGVSLVGGGAVPIIGPGNVAAWDTSAISEAAYYTIRLTVTKAGFTSSAETLIYLEPDLLSSNFPKFLYRGAPFSRGLVPGRGSDGASMLFAPGYVVGGTPNVLWRLQSDAESRELVYPGWGSQQQVSLSDLDGDGSDEAIVQESDSLWSFHLDGRWTQFMPMPAAQFSMTQPEIEDLDGDSRPDVLALGDTFTTPNGYLYAWHGDGTPFGGKFPILLSDQDRTPYSDNQRRFLVAELNGDGNKQIVAGEGASASSFRLSLFGRDGSRLSWGSPVMNGRLESMVASDLEHNGKLEVIVLSHDASSGRDFLHVLQPDGTERPGWPASVPGPYDYGCYLATSDLGREGREDIILAHPSGLFVYRDDGKLYSQAWPLPGGMFGFSGIAIGDVDGDGYPEIVSTYHTYHTLNDPTFSDPDYINQEVYAYRRDATVAKRWQMNGASGYTLGADAIPLIGDFNQDGITDIALAYGLQVKTVPGPGAVTVVSTGAPFHPASNDWPMLFHDARNTGVRQRPAAGWDPGPNPNCTYSLSAGTQMFAAAGGNGSFDVTTSGACSWTVSSPAAWVALTGAGSGHGGGSVAFSVAPNTGSERAVTLAIANQTYSIRQQSANDASLPFFGSMPHIASGAGWVTSFTLLNTGVTPADSRLDFHGDDGKAVLLSVTSPQAWLAGTVVGTTVSSAIKPHGLMEVTSGSGSGAGLTGSAQVFSAGDVNGFALFTSVATGQSAVVPLERRNAPAYFLPFDNSGTLRTGLAIENLGTASASVRAVVRDDQGVILDTRMVALPPTGHSSFLLDDATQGFPAVNGKRGSIELDSPAGGRIAVLGLRANGPAITTLPVVSGADPFGGTLAHFASGAGWETLITLLNAGDVAAQATLSFFDDGGRAFELPLFLPQTNSTRTASSVTFTLAAGASVLIQTQTGSAQAMKTGSAQIATTGSVSGFAIFQNAGQEAAVPLRRPGAGTSVLVFDNTSGLATGVALVNGAASPTTIRATLRDDSGWVVDSAAIDLPGWGHKSQMLTQLFAAAEKVRGSVEFAAPAGGLIDALGIRATQSATYTTIPTIAGSR